MTADDPDLRTDADRLQAAALLDADPRDLATALRAYYVDPDRAARTPRKVLYLHLGRLSEALHQLAQELDRRDDRG